MGKSQDQEFQIGFILGKTKSQIELFARGTGIPESVIAARMGQIWGLTAPDGHELGDADQLPEVRHEGAGRAAVGESEVEVADLPRRLLPGKKIKQRNYAVAPEIMELVAGTKKPLTRKEICGILRDRHPEYGPWVANGAMQGLLTAKHLLSTPKGIVLGKTKYIPKAEPAEKHTGRSPAIPAHKLTASEKRARMQLIAATIGDKAWIRDELNAALIAKGIAYRSATGSISKMLGYGALKKLKDGRIAKV